MKATSKKMRLRRMSVANCTLLQWSLDFPPSFWKWMRKAKEMKLSTPMKARDRQSVLVMGTSRVEEEEGLSGVGVEDGSVGAVVLHHRLSFIVVFVRIEHSLVSIYNIVCEGTINNLLSHAQPQSIQSLLFLCELYVLARFLIHLVPQFGHPLASLIELLFGLFQLHLCGRHILLYLRRLLLQLSMLSFPNQIGVYFVDLVLNEGSLKHRDILPVNIKSRQYYTFELAQSHLELLVVLSDLPQLSQKSSFLLLLFFKLSCLFGELRLFHLFLFLQTHQVPLFCVQILPFLLQSFQLYYQFQAGNVCLFRILFESVLQLAYFLVQLMLDLCQSFLLADWLLSDYQFLFLLDAFVDCFDLGLLALLLSLNALDLLHHCLVLLLQPLSPLLTLIGCFEVLHTNEILIRILALHAAILIVMVVLILVGAT